ncbi:MAG: histidinol-phosphate transaminase [Bacteroidota bacterium]
MSSDFHIIIPDHIKSIKSYSPGKTIPQLQREFGWSRISILWNNENTLGYSAKSKEAVIQAYERINYYPDPLSIDLRQKLSEKHQRKVDEIMLGNGSESVLMLAIKAFCSGGDQFLTSEGGFVIIYNWAKMNGTTCVTTPLNTQYEFDLPAISSCITNRTKVIYLANTNNPTGTMISRSKLDDFLDQVPKHILVIVDEAYFEFSNELAADFPDTTTYTHSNLLTLRTFSKAYGIAGVRLGYGIARPEIIEALMKVKLTFEPTALAQAAGLGALSDTEFLDKTVKNNSKELSKLYQSFDRLGIKYVPSFANFIMTIWDSEKEVQEVFTELMKVGVLVRPLMPPVSHCIRISVGIPEENQHLIESLEVIVKK